MKQLHGKCENHQNNDGDDNVNNENGKNGSLRALVAMTQAAIHKFSSKLGDVTVLSNKVVELKQELTKENKLINEKLNQVVNVEARIPSDFVNFCRFVNKETKEQKQLLLSNNKTSLQMDVKLNSLSKKVTDLEQTMNKIEEIAVKQQQKEKHRFYAVCVIGILVLYINLLTYKQVYFTNNNITPTVSDVVSPVNTATSKVEMQNSNVSNGDKVKKSKKSKSN